MTALRLHLGTALDVLAREAPTASRHLAERVGRIVLRVRSDGDGFTVAADGPRLRVGADGPDEGAGVVGAGASGRELLRLLDGDDDLDEAVLGERVWIRGDLDDVLVLEDALGLFLNGAVRAPSMPRVLDGFRRAVEAHERGEAWTS